MKIFDISMTVDETIPVFKNKEEKRPKFTVVSDYTQGTTYESTVCMNLHTGTHIDAPLHMLEGGSTFETIDILKLITKCLVVDFTSIQDKITEEDLKKKDIQRGSFILLKTRNSARNDFDPEFVYVDSTGAGYLRDQGISGVGIDSLGIERAQPGHETHKILFEAGIIIVEGLRLAEVDAGEYQMFALPVKMAGTEAAPARVILLKE